MSFQFQEYLYSYKEKRQATNIYQGSTIFSAMCLNYFKIGCSFLIGRQGGVTNF